MKTKINYTIQVEKCSSEIPLATELLSILDLQADGVLWKKTDQEYYLFNKNNRDIFVQEMKDESGIVDFHYTKEGRDFISSLFKRASSVSIQKKGLHLPESTQKKVIQDKEFIIKMYL